MWTRVCSKLISGEALGAISPLSVLKKTMYTFNYYNVCFFFRLFQNNGVGTAVGATTTTTTTASAAASAAATTRAAAAAVARAANRRVCTPRRSNCRRPGASELDGYDDRDRTKPRASTSVYRGRRWSTADRTRYRVTDGCATFAKKKTQKTILLLLVVVGGSTPTTTTASARTCPRATALDLATVLKTHVGRRRFF